jgi:hypothetical protein
MANHPSRLPILATICAAAAIVAMPGANAASKFDGTWTAVFRTRSGPCQPAYRGAVQVVDGVMEVGGTMGSLIGRVSRNGSVRATGYMGANYGVASGRVGQFRQWNVARSHGKRELRRCLERAATIISHLPPRGLVQTRTATSRYGIFLSGGGPQAGPALYCGPVLRHAAEPTQAANCRSSTAS